MHPRLHNFNVRIPERGCLGTRLGARPSKIRGSGSETIHAVGNLAHFLEPASGGVGVVKGIISTDVLYYLWYNLVVCVTDSLTVECFVCCDRRSDGGRNGDRCRYVAGSNRAGWYNMTLFVCAFQPLEGEI